MESKRNSGKEAKGRKGNKTQRSFQYARKSPGFPIWNFATLNSLEVSDSISGIHLGGCLFLQLEQMHTLEFLALGQLHRSSQCFTPQSFHTCRDMLPLPAQHPSAPSQVQAHQTVWPECGKRKVPLRPVARTLGGGKFLSSVVA